MLTLKFNHLITLTHLLKISHNEIRKRILCEIVSGKKLTILSIIFAVQVSYLI